MLMQEVQHEGDMGATSKSLLFVFKVKSWKEMEQLTMDGNSIQWGNGEVVLNKVRELKS